MPLESIITLIAVGVVAYWLQKLWISSSWRANLVSKDLHKAGEVRAVRIGALPHAMVAVISLCWAVWALDVPYVLMASSYYALLGLADDVIGLRNLEKIIYSSFPLIAAYHVYKPFKLWFALPYPLMAIISVLFVVYVANAVNTLAGFNGLEMGSTAIISGFLALISLIKKYENAFFVYLILFILSLIFLKDNWYPAKAFPGNVGTFFFGGILALASSIYGLYWEMIILTLPHGVDFFLKLISWRRTAKKVPAKVRSDGTLEPPGNLSLAAILIRKGINKEKKIVVTILAVEALLGVVALTYSLLTLCTFSR